MSLSPITVVAVRDVVRDRTSLMIAAENGHVAVCDYLIRQAARLDAVDVEGASSQPLLLTQLLKAV